MLLQQFPNCCGIGIIHELSSRPNKTFDDLVAQAKRSYGVVLVSMNHEQYESYGWGKAMTKHKFKLVNEFENRNSSNTVYLYSKEF